MEEQSECVQLRTLVELGGHLSSSDFLERLSKRGHVKKDEALVTTKALCDDFLKKENASSDDRFQKEVAKKTKLDLLQRVEAEREVVVDWLIEQEGNKDKALIYAVGASNSTEPKILMIVNTLLFRRANPSAQNSEGKTPLHFAAQKGFVDVVRELLFKGARPDIRDNSGQMPVHIAVGEDSQNDDIAALLLLSTPHEAVRDLFTVRDDVTSEAEDEKAELSLHDLITNREMQQTVMAVLSCMMDPIGQSSSVRVHYHVLDADENGRSPRHEHFKVNSKSCLHFISKGHYMDFVYHDVVRFLLKRKWTQFARHSFKINAGIFVFFECTLCIGAVLASGTADPTHYGDGVQITRGVMELLTLLAAAYTFVLEVIQIKKHKLDYFKDKFNMLGLLSSLALMGVVPLRFTNTFQQWPVYSTGFILWTLRIFNFAAVFRVLGAYSQVLGRILQQDFPQFFGVFAIILITFSGSFLLALRGEDLLNVHQETSTFWDTLLTGVRILIEGQPVVDYYGSDGYKGFSAFLMLVFLGTCCVVLLNILIAQLSDTYKNVQSDAHRGLELNRAWIISRVELHSIYHNRFRKPHRISKYEPFEDIVNPKAVLKKWDSPPLSEINRHVKDIKDLHDVQSVKLRSIAIRMKRQEEQLNRIFDLLSARSKAGAEILSRSGPYGQLPVLSSVVEGRREDTNADSVVSENGVNLSVE